MIAGNYTLHLYCRYAPESPQAIAPIVNGKRAFDARHYDAYGEFTHEAGPGARQKARRAGWNFGRDRDVTCPACIKHGPGHTKV